jgi:hypothetical protein
VPAPKPKTPKTFADYKPDGRNWITLATGEYYPDILKDACKLYEPVLVLFGQLLRASESSARLFMQISEQTDGWMRVQLARVFRKYVSPETPVEMLKQKSKAAKICDEFGKGFRPVHEVQAAFSTRPASDEALCAVLWEYKDRGKKGYDLTERLFALFRENFPDLPMTGPERAGKDILLGEIFPDYPKPDRPVDFVIRDPEKGTCLSLALRATIPTVAALRKTTALVAIATAPMRCSVMRASADCVQKSSSSTMVPACSSAPCGTTTPHWNAVTKGVSS